ncbi:hypothetical protein [Mannheimia haemolytica]|uniref:hypothetical protein n=1 Tax=Mannheimia haemolytica TaxID=75985 RepID=UPI003D319146
MARRFRIAVIEQREQSAQPSQPQAEAVTMPQQDAVAINNINAVLEAVEKYKTFEKYNTQWQERFEKFLSRNAAHLIRLAQSLKRQR